MCRWLLHMRDLAGGDDLMLTQEYLGQMLNVRRPSVSMVASPLQKAGIITCECYGTVKAHYKRLL